MAEPIRVEADLAGDEDKTMLLETGKYAGLADGSVMVGLGETRVLVTATAPRHVREGTTSSRSPSTSRSGCTPRARSPARSSVARARAGESAILTCRLIDRPLRPSFPAGFRNEVHVVGTVMGADQENPYDVLAINGASAALMLSDVAFDGPIGAVRLAYTTDGEWLAHPTYEESDDSTFEIVVAGRQLDNGDIAVMMVEAGGTEKSWGYYEDGAPKVDEAALATALEESKHYISDAIALQKELVDGGRGRSTARSRRCPTPPSRLRRRRLSPRSSLGRRPHGRGQVDRRQGRADRRRGRPADRGLESVVPARLVTDDRDREADRPSRSRLPFRSLTKATVRSRIVNDGVRIDGRGPADIRPLSAEVGDDPHRARHRAVPAWRDPGAQLLHPRDAQDGPDGRRHRAADQEALPAPLQLPALLHRRARLHAGPEAPRDRPRCPRRAGRVPGGALARGVPLHDPPGVGGAELQRLHLDGVGVRVDPVADGRRCAASRRRSPASPWASSTRTASTPPSPTSSEPRTPSATWTSRSPARRTS